MQRETSKLLNNFNEFLISNLCKVLKIQFLTRQSFIRKMNLNVVLRTLCLFTLCICLVIVMMQSYIDLYKARICSKFRNAEFSDDISASDKPWNYNWDL